MGISSEQAAPMLASMSDDQLRAQLAPAIRENIKNEAAAQLAAMSEEDMCAAMEAAQPPFTVSS